MAVGVVVVAVGVMIGGVSAKDAVPASGWGPASGWEVTVAGVEVAVGGVVVAVGVIIRGVEVAVAGVEVACGEPVESAVAGVVVAVGSRTVSSGISGMIVDPRCLLSHSATAVTPSCQES